MTLRLVILAALLLPGHSVLAGNDPDRMEASRNVMHQRHGGQTQSLLSVDQFEYRSGSSLILEGDAWWGGDLNKLWLKADADYSLDEDEFEEAELQLLYSRAITAFWDVQAGLRHDFQPKPARTYAAVGILGLAPYWLEVDAALFLSEQGKVSLRVEAEYDVRLTQRLILQPKIELDAGFSADRDLLLGSGLRSGEIGLRLRYEVIREIAPYFGVIRESRFGSTADQARRAVADRSVTRFVAGIRLWY